jgi:hypothetical protein
MAPLGAAGAGSVATGAGAAAPALAGAGATPPSGLPHARHTKNELTKHDFANLMPFTC